MELAHRQAQAVASFRRQGRHITSEVPVAAQTRGLAGSPPGPNCLVHGIRPGNRDGNSQEDSRHIDKIEFACHEVDPWRVDSTPIEDTSAHLKLPNRLSD